MTVSTVPRKPTQDRRRSSPRARLIGALSSCLVTVSAVAAGGSLMLPDVLHGAAVTDGNLRGTAVVVLVVALPVALLTGRPAQKGDIRGLAAFAGAVVYLTYQGFMFCFGTPFNQLFLAYVAMWGLGLWTLAAMVPYLDRDRLASSTSDRTPFRMLGAVLGAFATLNALGWLVRIVPATATGDPARGVADSGLLTSPVWVQDLALWIPVALVAAVLAWRRRPLGVLMTSAMLTFYVIEGLSVASDQWWGVRADSGHPDLASTAAVPGALVAAALAALPLAWWMHSTRRQDEGPRGSGAAILQRPHVGADTARDTISRRGRA